MSRALHTASRGPALDPYVLAPGAQPILHLLFVDNYLLIGRAIISSAIGYKRILEDHCLTLGQKVNLHKSTIHFSPRISV